MVRYCGLGSKGLFSLDAVISLIILMIVIMLIPRFNPNLDKSIVYKEASDVSSVIILSNSLKNPALSRIILEKTNPELDLSIEVDGTEIPVKWSGKKRERIVIVRPVFDKRMKEVKFTFAY